MTLSVNMIPMMWSCECECGEPFFGTRQTWPPPLGPGSSWLINIHNTQQNMPYEYPESKSVDWSNIFLHFISLACSQISLQRFHMMYWSLNVVACTCTKEQSVFYPCSILTSLEFDLVPQDQYPYAILLVRGQTVLWASLFGSCPFKMRTARTVTH